MRKNILFVGNRPGCRNGQILVETAIGAMIVAVIIGGIALQIIHQATIARRDMRRTKVRLVLEGELEYMRGLPTGSIRPVTRQIFTPQLMSARLVSGVQFVRTVAVDRKTRLARIHLQVLVGPQGRQRATITVDGMIYISRMAEAGEAE